MYLYLSVLCTGSLPFLHMLMAVGKACGLHSMVTVLPVLALSRALRGLLEKSGGEAMEKHMAKRVKLLPQSWMPCVHYCKWTAGPKAALCVCVCLCALLM